MDLVLVDRPQPHTAVVTLNRPDRLNAMSIDLVIALYDALEEVEDDNDTWVVVLTGAGRGFCSGLDLKDYGVIPNIDGLSGGAHRAALDALLLPARPAHAADAPAGHRRGQRAGLRRRDVPGPRRRHPHRVADAVFNSTGIVNGLTSTELGVSWLLPRLDRRRDVQRHPADRPEGGRGGGADASGWCHGCVPTTTWCPTALEIAARCAQFSPYGLAMTKDIIWVNLENPSLESAIEIEDRNQLMLGFTENLPEAIRAFDQGRAARVHRRPAPRPVRVMHPVGRSERVWESTRPAGGPRERSSCDLRGRCPLHARGDRAVGLG